MFVENITYPAALLAGLLSFFSPCILPLIPAYFSFITGLSLDELTENSTQTRKRVILSTLFYVAGVSSTFIMLGGAASFLGNLLAEYDWVLRYLGGAIVIVFGLHMLSVINIHVMNFEKKVIIKERPIHLLGIFFIGMAFGVGWTPCIGPIFSAILLLAGQEGSVFKGISLLTVYSAGFAVPFLVMAVFISSVLNLVKSLTKYVNLLNKTAGTLLVLIGLLLIFDKLRFLTPPV